jgi:hypothetical protein
MLARLAQRHGLSSPIATVIRASTGELSPMAFLVGVILSRVWPVTPTRCVQRLRSAVACSAMSAMADLNRGRIALPPRVEGPPSTQGEAKI